ncbi:MAG: ExbD/TolR family protein [bacterium]
MGGMDVGGGGAAKKGGGHRRPQRRAKIRIDMTPMVDVAFLLLIFFMVTTVFRRPQALELTIPQEKSEQEIPERNVLQIRVTSDEKLYYNVGFDTPTMVEPATLHTVVGDLRTANPALAAVIKIHREAPYHWMVDVLDEIALGDLKRYGLAPFTDDDKLAIEGDGG